MAVPRSFTDLVAQYGGFDPEATFQLLNQWQPYEGGHTHNNATYNYLNTTQDMGGSPSMNSVGVRQYKSEDEGARATAQTLTNGRYGAIVNALKTGDFSDTQGIAGDVRVWTSGSREGGSNFADSLSGGIDIQTGGVSADMPTEPDYGPFEQEADIMDGVVESWLEVKPSPDDLDEFGDPKYYTQGGGGTIAGVTIGGEKIFNKTAFATDLAEWNLRYGELNAAAQQLRMASYDLTTLPDGTVVAIGDLPPEMQQQARTSNYNVWASAMNSVGLADYANRVERERDTNEVTKSNFDMKMDEVEAGLSYDRINIDRGIADVNRSLAGLEESRLRSSYINDYTAKWGLPEGKTGISLLDVAPGLFKASGSNIDPSLISINYPGTFDPSELMAEYDRKLGVTGEIPTVPTLRSQFDAIPKAPTLNPISTPMPSLLYPQQQTVTAQQTQSRPIIGPGGSLLPSGTRSYLP